MRRRAPLKAIFFDIDDTLFSTTHFAHRARTAAVEAMRRYGLRMPADHLLRELLEVISEFSTNYDHHFEKLLLRLPPRSYDGVNPAILVAAAVRAYHDAKLSWLRPYPEVVPVLKKLAGTDLIRGVITSGLVVKQSEKLLRLSLYEYFTPTAIFISDQIGISKPNPKLYQRACEEVGLRPSEAMYVGDHPTHDIDPSHVAGMITVHLKSDGKHTSDKGRHKADYEMPSLKPLPGILRKDFGISL